MLSDGEKRLAFWRKSDVWIFSPYERLNKLLSVLAGLIAIGVGVWILGRGIPDFPSAAAGFATSSVAGFLAICREMYHKGGNTGSKMQDSLDALTDEAERRKCAKALTETKHELEQIFHYGRTAFPVQRLEVDTPETYPKRLKEYSDNFRDRIVKCIRSCDEMTARVPEACLGVDSVEQQYQAHKLMEQIDIKMKLIDTIQQTIWPRSSASK